MVRRIQRINGFKVNVGQRRIRNVNYKVRDKPYKTKVGAIWSKGRYYRQGAYTKPRGWIRYRRK